jgi:Lrp/AsnC family transcriptional regulator, leucine-responsive regulatory protein
MHHLQCISPIVGDTPFFEQRNHKEKLDIRFYFCKYMCMTTEQTKRELDDLDWRILAELQQDARLSYSELGRRVALSQPAVAERVRRLENAGVIRGYHADVDLALIGRPITAYIRLQTTNFARLESLILTMSNVCEAHRVTGDDCALLKIRVESVGELGKVLDRLSTYARSSTSVVLSSIVSRPLPLQNSSWDS